MSDYVLSLILGIVEGVTEFLPVSSTAHLRLAQSLLDIDLHDGYWKMYAIVIQLGAILCLPLYFRRRITELVSVRRPPLAHPVVLTGLAFVTTAIPAFLLSKLIGKNLESLTVMGVSLIVGGALMWGVDAAQRSAQTQSLEQMGLGQALWIGVCQILSAVFPGTSRSMSTITGAQLAGVSRVAAVEFSFLLSMPTMAAATGYELFKYLRHGGGLGAIDPHGWGVLAVGFFVSFAVAYASVAWLLAWVRSHGMALFGGYRLALGSLVLLFAHRLAG
jgi:undecaprenyl-diphosphatase